MLGVAFFDYFAECHYAEFRGAVKFLLKINTK
jgi:hypothetical protein